ncbi:hypothetical protein CROQUDRAFT_668259 [Cronartium quercuum f. sp. fusiforme G11]|uniref:Transmembrane protein n=1 Tax=Cronartium quercuum f. sp. fusiforme G11 TaxID=708437 RepID=A0A9P6NPI1_9BASI|nr:hypothetical protein CROQUDRAFT_668259 [Cronartium quercuum f. sp. fusiforme G11]
MHGCILALSSVLLLVQVTSTISHRRAPASHHIRSNFGPLSELAGTTSAVDSITSPGESRSQPVQSIVRTVEPNTTPTPPASGLSSSTCAVSFSQPSTDSLAPSEQFVAPDLIGRDLSHASLPAPVHLRINKRDLTNQILLSDSESSALFMTEVADGCVKAMRAAAVRDGRHVLPGVVTCYSLGYIDPTSSTFGGYLSVFRIGNMTELEELSGSSLEELSQNTKLQLAFTGSRRSPRISEFVKSTEPGTFDFKKPALAPSDDPEHLINPTNPQYTASCAGREMVLIGTFHVNLVHATRLRPAIFRRDGSPHLSVTSPIGTRLVGRGTQELAAPFFDLTPIMTKRSNLVRDSIWGLFKRSLPTSSTSRGVFLSDSACVNSGLSPNPFFTAPSNQSQEQPPPSDQVDETLLAVAPIAAAAPTTRVTPSFPVQAPTTPIPTLTTLTQPQIPTLAPIFPVQPVPVSQAPTTAILAVPTPNPNPIPEPPPTPLTATEQNTPTEASAAETPFATAFQLPGRSLKVLPIGLGIFAGVSLITIISVGIVTFERARYRKQFRERKGREQIANAAGLTTERNPVQARF